MRPFQERREYIPVGSDENILFSTVLEGPHSQPLPKRFHGLKSLFQSSGSGSRFSAIAGHDGLFINYQFPVANTLGIIAALCVRICHER